MDGTADRRPTSPIVTSEDVWRALFKASFAVISHTTPTGDPRGSGVLFKVAERRMYVSTAADSWKARHVADSHRVAMTVLIRRGGILSLLAPIPPATITFHGTATVHPPGSIALPPALASLVPPERREECSVIEVVPEGHFLTYGLGVSLMTMRHPDRSRARVPVRDADRPRQLDGGGDPVASP